MSTTASTIGASSKDLPLDAVQFERLQQGLSDLSAVQLQWASGYAAGLAAANEEPLSAAEASAKLTILYGSQTGNGEGVARELEARAREQGFPVKIVSLADYKPQQLKRESLVTFVVSTHGEGDPPDDAELFHEFLLSKKAPTLDGLKYSVLALGDSSYINFCQTGREFDTRLAELGGERLLPLAECDLDYEDRAAVWRDRMLAEMPPLLEAKQAGRHLRAVHTTARFDKQHPFSAEVLLNQKITAIGSSKDVRHIELALEGSGIRYQPGDSLGVVVENPPQLVRQFIDELDLDADTKVLLQGEAFRLEEALTHALEITAASASVVKAWGSHTQSEELQRLLKTGAEERRLLAAFLDSHQIIDIVRQYPAVVDAQSFVDCLRKLSPRSYSIASSQQANPDEVHLTVAPVRYRAFGSDHWGAASTQLADRLSEGDMVSVYVETNSRFRLPADDNAAIIMIGPGTGVAPFRAFLEERAERGATGKNWLFFGDRNFSTDFLYQLEWQRHLKQGTLHRLDVAFSRDQREKQYVQDRIPERSADIYSWLQDGAFVYVCGDAKHMAGDVDAALEQVLTSCGGLSEHEAQARLKEMRRSGRYQRDVY